MRFFMMSKCGEGCGLLKKIQDEGNKVRLYIKEPDYYSVYKGILENEKTCSPNSDEIVIFDSSSFGEDAEKYRRKGIKCFGGGEFQDKLENDRRFGLEFMSRSGISIPDTFYFSKNWKLAYELVNNSEYERLVFKPSGDLPSRLTYCGCDREDLLGYMRWVEKYFGSEIKDFVLQEFIEGAIVSSEFWMGPNGFIEPANQTVEVKKFMNDDLGQSTGCQGNLVWRCDASKVLERGIRRAEKNLQANNLIGPIDLNCIVNETGVYGLEWTPRFGLDAMPTFLQLLNQDVGKLIADTVNGQAKQMDISEEFASGVRISIPPYPLEPPRLKSVKEASPNYRIPLQLPEEYEEHFYLYEVMLSENDELVHSAGTGVIAVVSATDKDCRKATGKVYDILEDVQVPDLQYRTDLDFVFAEMHEDIEETELCLS